MGKLKDWIFAPEEDYEEEEYEEEVDVDQKLACLKNLIHHVQQMQLKSLA